MQTWYEIKSYPGGTYVVGLRVTTQIWVVTRHQYGISALVSKTSFRA